MSRVSRRIPTRTSWLLFGAVLLIASVVVRSLLIPAYGAQLGNRRLMLGTTDVGVSADYLLSFDLSTAGNLGSIVIEFCSNDPIPGDPCTVPPGFDDSSAVLADQSGDVGFSIDAASTANKLLLTRTIANAPIGSTSYHFTGIKNPTSPGSYYARLLTYATTDATGPSSDYGGIAFAILNLISITAEVPPYLIFCTGITISGLNCSNAVGDYIDFGELLTTKASSASSQFLVATNAASGYNITASGSTLASGINVINPLATNDVSRPGVSQFGFNLRANTTPPDGSNPFGPGVSQPTALYNVPDSYRFVSGDIVVTNPVPDDLRLFTASYIVNRPIGQAPGIYVSTITYIALAKF